MRRIYVIFALVNILSSVAVNSAPCGCCCTEITFEPEESKTDAQCTPSDKEEETNPASEIATVVTDTLGTILGDLVSILFSDKKLTCSSFSCCDTTDSKCKSINCENPDCYENSKCCTRSWCCLSNFERAYDNALVCYYSKLGLYDNLQCTC